MADGSFSESQGERHRFIDHTDMYTYKLAGTKDDVERRDWSLNCVVVLNALIEEDESKSEGGLPAKSDGGFLATVTIPDRGSLDPSDHSSRKRVTRLGRQTDGKTFVFGPEAVFVEMDGVVKKTTFDDVEYAWIPLLLPEMSIATTRPDVGDLFRDAVAAFRGKSMYEFSLTLGAFYMGMHYDAVIDTFHRCPVVVCLGKTNCRKTYAVTRSANFIAANAASILEHKSLTSAAAPDILSHQSMSALIHDPPMIDPVKTMVEETYERKSVTTTKDRLVPHTSVIITCNHDVVSQMRNGEVRLPSRLMILPFDEELPEQSALSCVENADLPTSTGEVMELLLQMGKKELHEIAVLIDMDKDEVSAKLWKYGMQESVTRISFNIRMVHAFTVQVLGLMDKHQTIDLHGLRDFVLNDVVRCAAMWQTPSGTKRKYHMPAVPTSPAKKFAKSTDPKAVSNALETVASLLEPDELKQAMRTYTKNNGKEYVAFKDTRAVDFLKKRSLDTTFVTNFLEDVQSIADYVPSKDVRFAQDKTSVKGMLVPISHISSRLLGILSGKPAAAAALAAQPQLKSEEQVDELSAAAAYHSEKSVETAEGDGMDQEQQADNSEETDATSSHTNKLLAASPPRTPAADASSDRCRFPSPASSKGRSSEESVPEAGQAPKLSVRKATNAGSSAPSAKLRFDPKIVAESRNDQTPTDCKVCHKDFPAKDQLLKCKTCCGSFHRDCQVVKTGTFLRQYAKKWECKGCKLAAKQATGNSSTGQEAQK